MNSYKWISSDSSFVLYKNDEPTDITVIFNKGIWEIHDKNISLPQSYYDTPAEAMDSVNHYHNISASYNEQEGLTPVIDSIKKDIDNHFNTVDNSLTTIRNNLNHLVSIYQNDEIFTEVSLLIDDYLLDTFRMNKNIRKRLDDLVCTSENRRRYSK